MHVGMFLDKPNVISGLQSTYRKLSEALRLYYIDDLGLIADQVVRTTTLDIYAPPELNLTNEQRKYVEAPEDQIGIFWDGVDGEFNLGGVPILVPAARRLDNITFTNERPLPIILKNGDEVQPGEQRDLLTLYTQGAAYLYKAGQLVPYIERITDQDTLLETTSFDFVTEKLAEKSEQVTKKLNQATKK